MVERLRNPLSHSFKLGMRRKIRLTNQISWYIKKNHRSTILHRLFKHGLLP